MTEADTIASSASVTIVSSVTSHEEANLVVKRSGFLTGLDGGKR